MQNAMEKREKNYEVDSIGAYFTDERVCWIVNFIVLMAFLVCLHGNSA